MARDIYFGTQEYMQWVPAPAINMGRSMNGWNNNASSTNGAAFVNRSFGGHRVYDMQWSMNSHENLYSIHAYASGDFGQGLIYFLDPFATGTNIMPQAWASPWIAAGHGGPNLAGTYEAEPTSVTSASNTQGYPVNSAVYTLAGTETTRTLWIPIPPGYTLHLGAHGSATSTAAVSVTPDGSAEVDLTLLGNNTTTLTNYTTAADGATIYFTGAGTLTLSAVVGFVLPTGTAAPTGTWRPGEGNSGCAFSEHPKETGYSAALNLKAVTAQLTEVGSWLT